MWSRHGPVTSLFLAALNFSVGDHPPGGGHIFIGSLPRWKSPDVRLKLYCLPGGYIYLVSDIQFTSTVMGGDFCSPSAVVEIRNRPSGPTSYGT